MTVLPAVKFPQAAGITTMLTAAGLDADAIHWWFGRPREELGWLSPAQAMRMARPGEPVGQRVLELAEQDAHVARQDWPAGWEGSD